MGPSLMMVVPMMSAGIRSGRELDTRELQLHRLGERSDQVGLAQAGHTLDQHVPADEQGGEDTVDDLLVSDDRFSDFAADSLELAAKTPPSPSGRLDPRSYS